jgi:hypothetical protein
MKTKPVIIFLIVFVIFSFTACDDKIKNNVTITNECGETIVVAVMESLGYPSSGITLNNGQSHSFEDLEYDKGYILIKSSSHGNAWYNSERMSFNKTYTIASWNGNGYTITYWTTVYY